MSLLAKLIAETKAAPAATLATSATRTPKCRNVAKVASAVVPDTAATQSRLLKLAEADNHDFRLVQALGDALLRECHSYSDAQLRALLSMVADGADRRALRRPSGDTAGVWCRKCGPVWVHPSIAAVLPVVSGWPQALGCPWCFVHPAHGEHIPRPSAPGPERYEGAQ